MNILYYIPLGNDGHPEYRIEEWKNNRYRGDLLYGITHFNRYDINTIFPRLNKLRITNKLISSVWRSFEIFFDRRNFEAVYTPYRNDLEILILLRSFGLFKKKIFVWQHESLKLKNNFIKDFFIKFYFSGIDGLFFFGDENLKESVHSGMITPEKAHVIKFGTDLDFFSQFSSNKMALDQEELTYISSGKDSRDFDTMINAFLSEKDRLKVYLVDKKLLDKYNSLISSNISLFYLQPSVNSNLSLVQEVKNSSVAIICCKPTRETPNGYSSLNEAMGLGKPIIITRNKYFDINVDKENIGISIEEGDEEGLKRALHFFAANPEKAKEMGRRARLLAENEYNLDIFSKQVATILLLAKRV